MQDDFNRFIRRSMRQAQCGYEDIFADPGCACGFPSDQTAGDSSCCRAGIMDETDMGNPCGCGQTMPDSDMNGSCGCCEKCEKNLPVMAFVEAQPFGRMYNEAEGLCRGTLFPALDKPFTGRGGCRK